jgi:hypothetical protein
MTAPARSKPAADPKPLGGHTDAEIAAILAEAERLLATPPKKPSPAATGRAAELAAQRRRAAAGKPTANAYADRLAAQGQRLAAILTPRRR